MAHVPFIGRLSPRDYSALILGLLLLVVEITLHVIVSFLPGSVLRWFYDRSVGIFDFIYSPSPINGPPNRPRKRLRRTRSSALRDEAAAEMDEDERGALTEAEDAENLRAMREADMSKRIMAARDFGELCELWGMRWEEHVVRTKDDYLLTLHRLPGDPLPNGEGVSKPVAYLHHGLLMNSEIWVCLTERERCLPFKLVEAGWDVWFGNNRGNKYSRKSMHHPPSSTKFWNFSIDAFAWYDIPDSIEYVLGVTGAPSLGYVGFSQGTAQAFAALSINPALNSKVNVFVGLAPAMSVKGLAASIVDGLMKASPTLLFLIFGRRSILSSAPMWQSLLYPPIFTSVIDASLRYLFAWRSANVGWVQRVAAYAHLYSEASVKCVVHWFQIMRSGAFVMYDDEVAMFRLAPRTNTSSTQLSPSSTSTGFTANGHAKPNGAALTHRSLDVDRRVVATTPRTLSGGGGGTPSYRPLRFPTPNIRSPIHLFYGTSDSLVSIADMLASLPAHTVATPLEGYEHVDVIWGRDVETDVLEDVMEVLARYRPAGPAKALAGSRQ